MKRKITLKQIAKELDVSISTVSKSLRNSLEIGEETRLKVQAFAKFYNYKPNNIALSLKNRKTKSIGIIIPEIVHYFFSTVINGIEQVANENGYSVVICLSDDSFDKEVLNMEMLANGSIDGFIMSLSKETQYKGDFHHITEVINQGMPVVMFDRVTNDILCDKVIIDDKAAAYEAVQSLIDNGRKKIALVTTVDYVSVGKLRTDGYEKALLDNGIPFNEDLIIKIEDVDTCEITISQLLHDRAFDAVFAVNELFAVTIIKTASKMGLKVPEDLAVIAFTDGIISKYSTPSITTVSQSGEKMGNKAAKMLIERLEAEHDDDEEENENYTTEVIETHLIKRESTD
ncbi:MULTISPECIES: LacI family DNA-binding transcriptional regulator [Flavobacterium]|jgi:LacI family transcriptional regulator|uniref:LacI family transcriptional regulator n=1 Tax=Flavobacterium fluviale TaxID=2249356 RepID=A0A344LQS6_9FLAO|nr:MULTISPECIES: LacI family DNA-binding transcriptional regulator [Flavobacterium]AXB56268.1 LacI family transcriptional regulator [Flavobacterium fluviale]KRD63206.1 LacI family transcriptional regulator [Flavobacterium sp. Root935]MDQ1163945.1 LacI family transcriptional regulator [Flavobacterium sp. SORGH_AS_0622]TDX13866.1 LacI family transcriptional regulator [Flavobacterium sp. S87F.05.LMB.W.Kidney.N]BDU24512.1 LacI family transcriptional regulator [Flavobacterium sp. GSB-24]